MRCGILWDLSFYEMFHLIRCVILWDVVFSINKQSVRMSEFIEELQNLKIYSELCIHA